MNTARPRIVFAGTASLALSLLATPAVAQLPSGARALGSAGSGSASARGHEALFANPANLGLSGNPFWSVSVAQLVVGTTLLGPRVEDLPELIRYDRADDARRAELLANIPEGGTQIRLEQRHPLVSISHGRVAAGASYAMTGEHSLSRGLMDLLFSGYEEGRTDYSLQPTQGSRATWFDFAAGAGHRAGPLSIGATGHLYRGRTLVASQLLEPRYDLAARDFEIDYLAVLAHGGSGYGLDVGAALQPIPSVTLSASLGNVFSRMEWSDELRVRSITLRRADVENMRGNAALDYLQAYESSDRAADAAEVSPLLRDAARELRESAAFPVLLRMGAAWAPIRSTELSVAYHDKLTAGRLSGDWDRTAAVGAEQRLGGFGVRVGYASDLGEASMRTAGLSLGPLHLGLAKRTDGELGGASRTGWIGTFGLSVQASAPAR